MYKILLFTIVAFFFSMVSAGSQTTLSFEFQAYPTGLVPGLRLELPLGVHRTFTLRAGYNWIRHRDLGVQDWESGSGFGGTLGYRYYIQTNYTGFFLGARSDFWRNTIDWEERKDNGLTVLTGTSKLWVIQPTLETGYQWVSSNGFVFAPTLAFGYEINVQTVGREVGQGPILLLGFLAGKRW